MKKINIQDFRKDMGKYLDNLPCALTRYGKVVAIITAPKERYKKKAPAPRKKPELEPISIPKEPISGIEIAKSQADATREAMQVLDAVLKETDSNTFRPYPKEAQVGKKSE